MRSRLQMLALIPLLAIALPGCPRGSGAAEFTADLSGDEETPPVSTNGSGEGTFALNEERTQLSFDVTASGLSGPVIAAHFHFANPGVAGPIVFDLGPFLDETNGQVTIQGTWDIDAVNLDYLLNEQLYVNIHTPDHPDGQIRGQVLRVD